MILGLVFWVADLFRMARITKPLTVSSILTGVVVYAFPDMPWWQQLSINVALFGISGVYYLRKLAPIEGADQAVRKVEESSMAANLVGTKVSLTQPLYPGNSKLEVNGRFWKVSASRDFPAGSVVEVVGYSGNTLEVVGSSVTRYGQAAEDRVHGETVPLDEYERDDKVEREYGEPNFDYWRLFQEALQEHRKLPLVYAYHVLSGLKGMRLHDARESLNTYTLALYDTNRPGEYLNLQKQMYSQSRIYSFLYMNGKWTGRDSDKFEEEINDLIAALHSEWAVKYRGTINAATVLRAVMMIRKQQVEPDK